jgi:outer membrane receptor protein involved in Fe transport
MKKLFILLAFMNCLPLLKADNFPKSNPLYVYDVAQKIKGTIIDGTDGKTPIEFATVALQNKTTNKVIDGATTDAKGEFLISNVAEGSYKIVISFVGFSDKTLEDIKVTSGKILDLGVIKLTSANKTLDEVTVTSQKSLIEEKVDRTIYNAEKDLSAKGGDAADVLRKVPLLSVDLEGNVSIRGSTNIKVLINNKPSTIMASSVADALKQIPADMIKTVEVITSPSAKYDAEGATGIINIITKKNDLQGYFLNVDIGTGNRSSMLGLQGSLRQGKFGATIGGHGRAMYNKAAVSLNQSTLYNNILSKTVQTSDANDNPIHGRYNIGLDYDIDKNQSLSGGIRFGIRNFSQKQNQTTELSFNNVAQLPRYEYINSKELSNSVDLNVDYIHIYKPQQELSISTQYSRNDLTNNFFRNTLDATKVTTLNSFKNINDNLNQESTLQIDYQTPLSTNQIVEFGGKAIVRQVNSNFDYLMSPTANGDYIPDPKRTKGLLDYTQKIGSAYTAYTFSTKQKYNFKAGLRYEYTDINAVDEKNINFNIKPYGILVPSINVSKSLKEGTTVKVGFSRRIQRPGLQQLNPNFSTLNTQSISVGNPNLTPEFTNNVELGLSTRFKQTFVNLSLFGNQTNDAISQVRSIYNDSTGAIITKFENIGKQKNIGLNFFGNVYLTPKWTLNGGFDVTYSQLEGQITDAKGLSATATNSGFTGGGRMMTNITLKNGWGIQGFGGMWGPKVQLQGRQSGFPMYALGVKKDFNNKKGSFGIAGENFFSNGKFSSEIISATLNQTSSRTLFNRGVRVNLAYKFGKIGFEQKKKTRSVKNDDVKDGGGGDGGGGGDAGGGGAQPQGGGRPQGGQGGPPQQGGQGRPNGTGAPQQWGQGRPNGTDSLQQRGQGRPNGTGAPQQGGQGRPNGMGTPPQGTMPNGAKMPEKPAKTGEKPQEKKEEDKGAPQKAAPIKQD